MIKILHCDEKSIKCTKCKEIKSSSNFYPDKSKKLGIHTICKSCQKQQQKNYRKDPEKVLKLREVSRMWRIENPERSKLSVRNATLKKKYGIGIEEYNILLEEQNFGCAICESTDTKVSWSTNLHVDHDHDTGAIRGLLCQACNTSLGKMNNNPDLLRKAAEYLERFK